MVNLQTQMQMMKLNSSIENTGEVKLSFNEPLKLKDIY